MTINKATELASVGNYPANRLNKRERKVLQVSNSYVPANAATWGATPPASMDDALNILATSGIAKVATVTYDFSINGGAAGNIPLGITLPNKAIVTESYLDVLTAVTGAGSLTFTVPVEGVLHTGSITSATTVGPQTTNLVTPKKLAADRILQATIATGITAGKVQFFVRYLIGS